MTRVASLSRRPSPESPKSLVITGEVLYEFWKIILRLNFSDKQSLLLSKLLNVKRVRDGDLRQRRRQFDLDGGVFVKDKCILPSN